VIVSPNLNFPWLEHGFGLRNSIPPPGLTTVRQIHSVRVLDACGRKGERIGDGDAIISSEPGVAVGIRTADCVPILIADPVTRIVGCVHAGWRGTAENITGATIDELRSRGCKPADLYVAIGPSIGSCCYSVGPEVARRFGRWIEIAGDGPSSLDLPAVNQMQLLDAGVSQIWKSGKCTYCNPDRFFSFRLEGELAGRMISFVGTVA
jgi:hypothetical protein